MKVFELVQDLDGTNNKVCSACDGTGDHEGKACEQCDGAGVESSDQSIGEFNPHFDDEKKIYNNDDNTTSM